ncbi:hypothetical protein COLO4_32720 [Corchorus olitorius]|uniref:Uncharacterized protein n=1 Tax=Corchorus olitorius TaxID=93759 RepID=A0A1R3GYE5_9ROSI|nr:hypothetical protein COLO4_32720 [Corchorus olitorius]
MTEGLLVGVAVGTRVAAGKVVVLLSLFVSHVSSSM